MPSGNSFETDPQEMPELSPGPNAISKPAQTETKSQPDCVVPFTTPVSVMLLRLPTATAGQAAAAF